MKYIACKTCIFTNESRILNALHNEKVDCILENFLYRLRHKCYKFRQSRPFEKRTHEITSHD